MHLSSFRFSNIIGTSYYLKQRSDKTSFKTIKAEPMFVFLSSINLPLALLV